MQPFTVLRRRHHCCKCGDIFCSACSSHTVDLLDSSGLGFIYPPKHTSIYDFGAPIHTSRVCDSCYDLIHGLTPSVLTQKAAEVSKRLESSPAARIHRPSRGPCGSSAVLHELLSASESEMKLSRWASYPLRLPSAVCKAAGYGISWRPHSQRSLAPLSDLMEQQQNEERRRTAAPLMCDDRFKYRRLRQQSAKPDA